MTSKTDVGRGPWGICVVLREDPRQTRQCPPASAGTCSAAVPGSLLVLLVLLLACLAVSRCGALPRQVPDRVLLQGPLDDKHFYSPPHNIT